MEDLLEPIIGKRYIVILVPPNSAKKKDFLGYTGVAIERYVHKIYPECNCILQFDDETRERYNNEYGLVLWRTGTEIVLLEDQSYKR